MSYLTQLYINMEDSKQARCREHDKMASGYPKGICPSCGSDEGLNEDGIPCGYCKKGIALDWGEE